MSQISDEVLRTVERIENEVEDPFNDLDPLEVKVEASIDGRISEIILVLTTGGPHIELALYAGRVDGSWGGESHSAPIMDDEADSLLDDLAELHQEHWEAQVIGGGYRGP